VACAKKRAIAEGRTILFLDESAFYLLPGVVRTWAPVGETPILCCKLTRDHYSVISAITATGELYLAMQTKAFDSATVIAFLEHLLRLIAGKLLIIWDGAPIHRSQAIKTFLAAGAAERIWLERLPGYAPDLNPDEGIWHYLKHVELKNLCCHDLCQLGQERTAAVQRLSAKPDIITACFIERMPTASLPFRSYKK
jgi:transposase